MASAELAEREKAAARRKTQTTDASDNNDDDSNETRTCAGTCNKLLSKSAFNRNQWSKGENKSRCRECVETAIASEAIQESKSKDRKITAARKKVDDLKKKGGKPNEILSAESELAALEAEKVTGLAPVKLSAGRGGRGRGRSYRAGRGRGRGR